jgi:pimeloyl-ACP methyl ester carboxylesterase
MVGHSIGGLVVQKYFERNDSPGAVLMASLPTRGTLALFGRIAVRHPLLLSKATFTLSLRPFITTPAQVREWFFSPDTPAGIVDCAARVCDQRTTRTACWTKPDTLGAEPASTRARIRSTSAA